MSADPKSTATTVLGMAQTGRFVEIADMFAPQLRAIVSADALQAAWDTEIARQGTLVAAGTPTAEPAGPGAVAVKIPLTFERGALTLVVAIGETDDLVGLQLAP